MTLFKHELHIKERQTMVDITPQIRQDIEESGIKDGIVVVYCPHTTAGITINENADPDVVRDLIYGFEKVYPTRDAAYRHFEGNSHAHMKSSTMGASQTLILSEGNPILGVWQDVYFCDQPGSGKSDGGTCLAEGGSGGRKHASARGSSTCDRGGYGCQYRRENSW